MYEDDQSSEGGPKSSFETYRAEGDVLFKQAAYKKAIESYNLVSIFFSSFLTTCNQAPVYLSVCIYSYTIQMIETQALEMNVC